MTFGIVDTRVSMDIGKKFNLNMTIIFLPIYIREKSDKELHEEIEREAKWRKLMEEDEARLRAREREAKERKLAEKERKEKEANDAYEALRRKDEWQTQFLPEGWNIFGQINFGILREYFEDGNN